MTDRGLLAGVLCMATGMMLIPVGDSIAKYLSGVTPYSPMFLAWSRFVVGTLLLLPVVWARGLMYDLGRQFYFRQAFRGALIATTITLIITAVSLSPVPDVFGAFFIGPALSVVFSALFLGERATRREWLAVVVGFIGVLLVVRPSGHMSVGLLWALGAGVFYGGFLVATRWSAGIGPPLAQLSMQLVFGLLFLLPFASGDLVTNGLQAPLLLLTMGLTSAMANFLSIMALRRASNALLAPVVYLQVVAATLIGVGYFGDPLTGWSALGLSLIVATGVLRLPHKSKTH